jgi:hypothetical protein
VQRRKRQIKVRSQRRKWLRQFRRQSRKRLTKWRSCRKKTRMTRSLSQQARRVLSEKKDSTRKPSRRWKRAHTLNELLIMYK